jgi:hypothetical protein
MEDRGIPRESREVSETSFTVNGREHGVLGLDAHRREASVFADLSAGRDDSWFTERAAASCGCNKRSVASARASDLGDGEWRHELSEFTDLSQHRLSSVEESCEPRGEGCGSSHWLHNPGVGAISDATRRRPSGDARVSYDDRHRKCGNPPVNAGEDIADIDSKEWPGLAEAEIETATCSVSLEAEDQFDAPPYSPYSLVTECGDPIDTEPAKFRYTDWGLGRCTGSRYDTVYTAFKAAYRRLRAAERDMEYLLQQPISDQKELWHGSAHWPASHPELSLAFWFGAANQMSFEHRRDMVYDVIRQWSKAFRHGYRWYHKPIFIFCRKKGWLPKGVYARHFPRDILDLGSGWFESNQNDQIQYLLHEMGHYSGGSLLYPRDERNPLCTGSWGEGDGDICYGTTHLPVAVPPGFSHPLFDHGNPRNLVEAFEDGNGSYSYRFEVMQDFLNNIDNYVCYMWNRWADRGSCILKTLVLAP